MRLVATAFLYSLMIKAISFSSPFSLYKYLRRARSVSFYVMGATLTTGAFSIPGCVKALLMLALKAT
jgi:hypothetical protein